MPTKSAKVTDQREVRGRAFRRVLLANAVGLAVGAASAFFLPWQAADLLGWDGAALWFLIGLWSFIGRLDPSETALVARRADPSHSMADAVVLVAGVACLVGAGLAFVKAGNAGGGTKAYLIALGLSSVVLAWGAVHSIFTLQYARLYYGESDQGIDFNGDKVPDYLDFAYVAFTIGMTFQVSDTNIAAKAIRRLALRHSLLSYLFGAFIIGMTINLVSSLLH